MLAPPAIRSISPPRCAAAFVMLLVIAPASAPVASGQAIQRFVFPFGGGFSPEPRKLQLSPPHVDLISGTIASRLEQAGALAADGNWDEAIDLLRELSADGTDRVVAVDDGQYVSLRTYCHQQIARLPAEALAAYRRRVDPLAERWYRDGLAARDEALLGRVIDELFCSSWGDDALLALGELALERGDYAAARRGWQQISPLTRDPLGRPLWLALRDIDLDKHWPQIEKRWSERPQPPDWLAFPDTKIELADVRARLVLASIRAGQLERAALELDAFRRWHPQSTGRLGGQEGAYTDALQRLLKSAHDWPATPPKANWPTFAGSPSRDAVAAPLGPLGRTSWPRPLTLSPTNIAPTRRINIVVNGVNPTLQPDSKDIAVRESARPIGCFPVVVDNLLLHADAMGVYATDVATGKPAITPDGDLYQVDATARAMLGQAGQGIFVAHGVPRYTLSVVDGIAYARVGRIETATPNPAPPPVTERLVGLDLRRDGLLTFQVRPDDESWSFDGAPVGDGRRVYVAMRHGDVTPHTYVACFDAATGRRLWRTSIGSADTPAAGQGAEITHNLLSLAGDRIYFNTNLGLVAALDTEGGRIEWLHRYERQAGSPTQSTGSGPLHFDRDPSPCLVHEGLVVVAPSDTPNVFALDADTGRQIWSTDKLADALHLLGVVDDRLIVTGNRFWSVDLRTGVVRLVWPESEHSGIRGMGRGVVAGNEIFWPTRKEIYVLDARTGARNRPPIDLSYVSHNGANLIAAQGYLVVAGRERLLATGPPAREPPDDAQSTPKVANSN